LLMEQVGPKVEGLK